MYFIPRILKYKQLYYNGKPTLQISYLEFLYIRNVIRKNRSYLYKVICVVFAAQIFMTDL